MEAIMSNAAESSTYAMVVRERQKSLMLRAWIVSGLFFMALPGTLLGFSNLTAIATHHGLGTIPAAWIQGHGHAQVFGWIGSFILGIGFYSQPAHGRSVVRLPLSCYLFWTVGVTARWVTSIYGWHWRALFPLSAGFELVAVLLFLFAASQHKLPESTQSPRTKSPMELWMVSVLLGTVGLAAAVLFNFVECVRLAVHGDLRSFPYALDQKYLVLLAWGFLVPVVWGFSARWLHSFLAISKPNAQIFRLALGLDLIGVLFGVTGWAIPATILLTSSAVAIGFALHLTQRPHGQAKVLGIHPSFPSFVRIAYVWLVIAGSMSIWAALADGVLHWATDSSSFCWCLQHLQQAAHVPLPAAAPDRLPAACFLRTAGLRRAALLCMEGAAGLWHAGVERSASLRTQPRTHLSAGPLLLCERQLEPPGSGTRRCIVSGNTIH
jgi:hypothetical protein